jgi:hypothetical protein
MDKLLQVPSLPESLKNFEYTLEKVETNDLHGKTNPIHPERKIIKIVMLGAFHHEKDIVSVL